MDKLKEFSQKLNGVEYGDIRHGLEELKQYAKENGIVIVSGASDDLMEFSGAIYDDFDCYGGGICHLNENGEIKKSGGKTIRAIWREGNDFTWTYKTKIPHETFDIFSYGDKYCKGIVFYLKDLKAQRDVVAEIKKIADLVLAITDEEFKELEDMAQAQGEYINPLKCATTARQHALSEHNKKMISCLRDLKNALLSGKDLQ